MVARFMATLFLDFINKIQWFNKQSGGHMSVPKEEDHNPLLARTIAKLTVTTSLILVTIFIYLYAGAPPYNLEPNNGGLWRGLILTLMFLAGSIGGCLYNFRGITKHLTQENFYPRYEMSYLTRPVSGGLCGLFVFVLVYGGVLTLSVSVDEALLSMQAVMLYVAISLLAGYGSHEFLHKVKELNKAIFAVQDDNNNQ